LTGFLLVLGLAGCRPAEEPPPNPAKTASTPRTEEKSPLDAAPVPVKQQPSAEERAARDAFLTMTREDVSQDDLDDAMEKLLAIGAPAAPVLAQGLRADEPLEREMAAMMLASLGRDAAAARDELTAALKDDSAFVRANAATALAQMEGQTAVVLPVFAEFLGGEDENLRKMMATNLGVLDASDAKPLLGRLTELLQHMDRDVQLAVVAFLGRMGADAQTAVEQLKALDTTDDAELETAVTAALLQIESGAE
jgi:HEAT repeat protein